MSALLKLIINFFSGDPNLPLIQQVGPSPNIKKLFLWLWESYDELLSLPKIITPWLHEHALSSIIQYLWYTYFSLSIFFTILVAPNKQFLNLKLLVEFLGFLNHRQC